jgi:anti-anti-sigma factor
MDFSAVVHADNGTATIRLSGELDAVSAPHFNDAITEAASHDLERLVILVQNLAYMSSAGLRCLIFAQQKMPPHVPIVIVGARPEVAEAIRLTGFDRAVVLQESGD